MRRVACIDERGEIVELTQGEAERVLDRDPQLAREWRKWDAKTGGRGGRLVALDGDHVRRLLACDGGDAA